MSRLFFQSMMRLTAGSGPVVNYLSALGDSITEGVALSSPTTQRWTKLLSDALGYTEVNGGMNGTSLQYIPVTETTYGPNGLSRYQNYKRASGKYVVAMGTNDIAFGGTLSQFITDYTTIINDLLLSYAPSNIVMCSILWRADSYNTNVPTWNTQIQSLATSKGVKFVDLYTPFINRNDLLADGLHPNAAGHVLIKDTILSAL